MQTEQRRITGVQRAARILLKVVLFLFLFIVLLFLLLLTPPVQRFATNKVEAFLQDKLKTRVEIGRIRIGLPRLVQLQHVYIEDRTKDTLLSGGSIKVNINLLALLSNKVEVRDIELVDITAKVKRLLPDTAFNFQFILDAFAPKTQQTADTSQTATMAFNVDHLGLDNIRIIYKDVVTGNDMFAAINNLSLNIDTLNPYTSHYSIPSLVVKGMQVHFNQVTPLAKPEPIEKDLADAAQPITMKLNIGNVTLDDVGIQYGNDVSAFYTLFDIGHLVLDGRQINLQDNILHLDRLQIDNTASAIRLGKKPEAREVAKQAKQEVEVQKQQNWVIRVDEVEFNKNKLQFDNDNQPKQAYGMDYGHFKSDSLTLHVRDFVMNTDTIAAVITQGFMKERSGFQLDALQGELLYAKNQAYLKNLYIKTPGTELKRKVALEYASFDALTKKPAETVVDLELVDSRIQVKDILIFAPQLRGNPALRDPNAVWHVNVVGSGTLNRLTFENFHFRGLKNTEIDASGTLAGLMNPTAASGTFTIHRFHTSQTDLAVFTGQRLSTKDINLPETFAASGTLSGNMGNMAADLTLQTSMGNIGVNGHFTNLTDPAKASYNAVVRAQSLQVGSIMRNNTMGTLTANMRVTGSGTTPDNMNVRFNGVINSFGYNKYTYQNVKLEGSFKQSLLNVTTDIRDPNIDLSGTFKMNLKTSALAFNGFVDSIKAQPLGFTTEPLTFRGRIDANVASMTADYLDANVSISEGLLVSGTQRLTLDSVQLVAGKNGNDQFIRLSSPIASGAIEGQFRYSDLGAIIQNNIDPYFSIVPGNQLQPVQPYNFTFRLDVPNSPFLSVFVPGLNIRQPIHIEGSMATDRGMQAVAATPSLAFSGMDITGLNATINTTEEGLQLTGTVDHLITGGTNLYHTRLNAIALDDVINFGLKVGDKVGRDKYALTGVLHQPQLGTYVMQLRTDSLLLNYEVWTINERNEILFSPNSITANHFSIQRGSQGLTIQSAEGMSGGPLNVQFTNFRMGTITSFMQADTLLADGLINGTVTFPNIMQQPVFTSNLKVDNLSIRGDTLGNLQLNVNSNRVDNYIVDINLTGFGNDVKVRGAMTVQDNDVSMNLDLAIQPLLLQSLQGVLADFVKEASGAIKGNISITGTTSAPKVQGTLNFDNDNITTYMLGGPLRINNESITVSEKGFAFDNFTIRDSVNNALNINGTVATTNFLNYTFNLDVDAQNFKVLNTTQRENKLFFGDLVISTRLHIRGTETTPVVQGNVSVNKGTNFTIVIPQSEPGVVQREGVVEFVDFSTPANDSLFVAYDSLNKTSVLGLDVSTNITIDREADFNVIVDVANGDLLHLRGTGQLSAGIDPSGNISLTGTYEIENGGYQFSFNFLRRQFALRKGSKITWYGEPTNAELDATAVYVANTAPLDLVSNQITDQQQRNYFLQKLPFNVLLNLKGQLLEPELSFDIVLPEEQSYTVSGDVLSTVNTRLAQLRQEPSELNKQVFSILLLNRFVGNNPFESSGGGFNAETFARQSVSKLLTEELNGLAAGLINGVDINFDLQSSDDYSTGKQRSQTNLNVGVSKRLLNDRLTVTVGSDFMLEGASQNQSADNIAGNVSVNYQLSRDNRYMLRFYRKNEYDAVVEGYVIETGMGFIMTVDYNRFREIFQNRRPRKQNEQATKEQKQGNK